MPRSHKRHRSAASSGRKNLSTAHHSSPRRKGSSRKRLGPSSPAHQVRLRHSSSSNCQDPVLLSGTSTSSLSRRSLSPLAQRRISYGASTVRGSVAPLLDPSHSASPSGGNPSGGSGQGDARAVSFAESPRTYSDVARGDKEGGGSTSSRSLASYGFVPTSSPGGSTASLSVRADGTATSKASTGNLNSSVASSQDNRLSDPSGVNPVSTSGNGSLLEGSPCSASGGSASSYGLSEVESVVSASNDESFLGDVDMRGASNDEDALSQGSVSASSSSDTAAILRYRQERTARLAAVEEENARRLASLPRIRRTSTQEAALACVGLTAEEHQAYENGIELEEEPHPFLDVIQFGDRIRFEYKAGLGRYPVYDSLKAKELKLLLKGRGQGTSGTKAKLMARLHSSDKRTLAQAETERLYKVPSGLTSEERAAFCEGKFLALRTKAEISDHQQAKKQQLSSPSRKPRSRSQSVGPRRRSASVSPRARSHTPVTRDGRAESVSSQDDHDAMSVDTDAQELFPKDLPSQVAARNRVRSHISSQVVADVSSATGRSPAQSSAQSTVAMMVSLLLRLMLLCAPIPMMAKMFTLVR